MIYEGVIEKSTGKIHILMGANRTACGRLIPIELKPKTVAVSDPVFPNVADPRCPDCVRRLPKALPKERAA